MRLRALAPGKVNLCLFLGPLREDGRHELVTLLESVSLADELTLEPASASGDEVICRGVEGPNLVSAALEGLRAAGWNAPPVRIEIAKRIPVAGGMAGGSADAAATLRLAGEVAPVRPEEAVPLAQRLGSDVPSQLTPGLWLGTGGGERVEPIASLAPHAFVILPQPAGLSAAEVYRAADRLRLGHSPGELGSIEGILRSKLRPGDRLPGHLTVNDLQPAAVSLHPEIAPALEAAARHGADQAFVSGSGPTVVGLFWGADAPDRAAAACEALTTRFPGATVAEPVGAEFALPRIA